MPSATLASFSDRVRSSVSQLVFLSQLFRSLPMVLVCTDADDQEGRGYCDEDHTHEDRQDIVDRQRLFRGTGCGFSSAHIVSSGWGLSVVGMVTQLSFAADHTEVFRVRAFADGWS